MSRLRYLCSKCKLDNNNMCDYESIRACLNYYFCPKFINNDGNPMTNADRIRSMTDEELAKLMDEATKYFNCDECEFRHLDDCGTGLLCQRHILKWLKQEVDENEET